MSCVVGFFSSWLPTEERSHVTRFVLRVPLTTLNQPLPNRFICSRRKNRRVLCRARWYNGYPKVSPEQTFFSSTEERSHVTRFVLRVPLTTLNQPLPNRFTCSRRKNRRVLCRARWYNGYPKVSPEQTCMLGTFPVVHLGSLAPKEHKYIGPVPRQLLAFIPTQLRETSVVGTITA